MSKRRWRARRAAQAQPKNDRTAKMMRANAQMRLLNLSYDASADAEMKAEHIYDELSCRGAGCYGCCHLFVGTTSFVEALHIVLTYPKVVKAAEPALEAQHEHMRRMGVERLDYYDNAAVNRFEEAWFLEKQLCPLLDIVTGQCGVYEARPLGCRKHHVLNEDPAVCWPPGIVRPVAGYEPIAVDDALTAQVHICADLLNGDVIVGPLQVQLLGALRLARESGLIQ